MGGRWGKVSAQFVRSLGKAALGTRSDMNGCLSVVVVLLLLLQLLLLLLRSA